MSGTDPAFAALHSCGKVVAASAWKDDDARGRPRALADARKWERRGDEIIEADVDTVNEIGWCDCENKGYPRASD